MLVDATLGMGGHTLALLTRTQGCASIGIDRDPQALRVAERRLAEAGLTDRVESGARGVRPDRRGDRPAARLGRVQAVLFDLGVSSVQLDEADRGFAYAQDAPLDMRMDPTPGITAADVRQHLPGRRTHPDPAGVRRGAVRQRIARRWSSSGPTAVHHQRAAGG